MTAWSGSTRRQRLPRDWPTIRRRILERDGWRCQLNYPGCTTAATDVDHITRGDDHRDTNLQAACPTCHAKKSSAEGHQAQGNGPLRRRQPEPHPGLVDWTEPVTYTPPSMTVAPADENPKDAPGS